jgi:hypothetical protein
MGLLEKALVGLIVAASAVCTLWQLLSLRARLRLLHGLGRLPTPVLSGWLARLEASTTARLASGCAGCAHQGPVKAREMRGP